MLAGGNVTPVVRIGDTVRRESGRWTPAVHELLRACEAAGVDGVPRVLGLDSIGREILSFLPGEVLVGTDALWDRRVMRDAAALLRRIHDASVTLVDLELEWRAPRSEPAEVICHNDFATYNLVLAPDGSVAAIDFDFASPGPRIRDLAYLAYRIAPWVGDATGADPDRHGSPEERVRALIAAYGAEWSVDEVRTAAADRVEELAAFTEDRAAATGRADFTAHAAMYRRDAARMRQAIA